MLLTEQELITKGHTEWHEFQHLLSLKGATLQGSTHQAPQVPLSQLMMETVGHSHIDTSSILQKHSRTVAFGLLATDPHEISLLVHPNPTFLADLFMIF